MSGRKQKAKQWFNKQRRDGFVRLAGQQGYRSRAVYKLQEIDQRDRLIASGMTVLELGSAPGGWSQYVGRKIAAAGRTVAVDLLPMQPIENVRFIQGDLMEENIRLRVVEELNGAADLVLSDMAPNITGIKEVDQARFIDLLSATLDFSKRVLRPGGKLLLKVFEGPEIKSFRSRCGKDFERVLVRKPSASKSQSREYYLLATGLRRPASGV